MCPKLKYNIENLSLNISINTALFETNLSELKPHKLDKQNGIKYLVE